MAQDKPDGWRRDLAYLNQLESVAAMLVRGAKPWQIAEALKCSLDEAERDIERVWQLKKEQLAQPPDESNRLASQLSQLDEAIIRAWEQFDKEPKPDYLKAILAAEQQKAGIYQQSLFDLSLMPVEPGNNVPGQAESIAAFKRLMPVVDRYPWAGDYKLLLRKGWYWRDAAIIAWSALDSELKQPKKKGDLAEILDCSTRTITNRQKNEALQMEIALLRAEPWLKHRHEIITEVIPARIESAKIPGKEGYADAKMVLQAAGLLEIDTPQVNVNTVAQAGVGVVATAGAINDETPDDELTLLLENLILAEISQRGLSSEVESEQEEGR